MHEYKCNLKKYLHRVLCDDGIVTENEHEKKSDGMK